MLRNVPLQVLADAIAPALVEMAELADEETQEELEEFAEEGRPYTFDLWLTNFDFDPFHETQPEIWQPFRDALDELPAMISSLPVRTSWTMAAMLECCCGWYCTWCLMQWPKETLQPTIPTLKAAG